MAGVGFNSRHLHELGWIVSCLARPTRSSKRRGAEPPDPHGAVVAYGAVVSVSAWDSGCQTVKVGDLDR